MDHPTTDILHRLGIHAPPATVFTALATRDGVAGWWTRATTGQAGPGGAFDVRFHASNGEEIGHMTFLVEYAVPTRDVRWRCTQGPAEWIGTTVEFSLAGAGDLTVVNFAHRHWREASEFTAHCSMKWATFLLSLRQYAETGTGRPAPDDLKIDDWN